MIKRFCDCCGREIKYASELSERRPHKMVTHFGFNLTLVPQREEAPYNKHMAGEFSKIVCELCQDCAENVANVIGEQFKGERL